MRKIITVTTMIHLNKPKCYDCMMDPPWVTKGRGRGNNTRGRGRSSPGSLHGSSSNSPVIQRGRMSLINSKISQNEASSSVHLEDIPESSPLFAQLQAYFSQNQSDTFASLAKEDIDDIKSYEKLSKKEMIFLLENSEIQRKEEPWKIFHTSSVEFQHFSGYNTSDNVYNFSKMIIKQIISVEDWGISTMEERQISLNKVSMSFTYLDYIHTFDKVLYYNNERHKDTWFIKNIVKILAEPIPNWWSYHGPTTKNLTNPFLKLYKEWVKNNFIFFIEFSIPWIHKWTPEVGFTEEQIPCLYRTFYNNFWDKLMKKDPKTKSLYGQELLDLIAKRIQDYCITLQKGIIVDSSIRHIARKISFQDGNKEEMINRYLEEVKKNLLLNITQYEKSDTSMRSDTSDGSLARKYIQNEFSSDKWNQFKTRFFDTYSANDLNNISQEFYETCALHNQIMYFVP
ncbi:hypothetical protein H5410_030588 [Solanum commersonii]|uniref:DUF7588 domain-containing protein n=1 Tax=Solanum commersonii TaxID=4109 RepID=A0A9J5YG25_SOLCO|nr:hypothetical protein H5410_030588 [Solanum commersonii]